MSYCPVAAARGAVLVRAPTTVAGWHGRVQHGMGCTGAGLLPATPVRRAARPATAALGRWRLGDGRGYGSNVFQRVRPGTARGQAVADPSSADAGVSGEADPVKLLTSDESEELLKIRHTTAHILAMATQKLFPDAQCTIGPWCVPCDDTTDRPTVVMTVARVPSRRRWILAHRLLPTSAHPTFFKPLHSPVQD